MSDVQTAPSRRHPPPTDEGPPPFAWTLEKFEQLFATGILAESDRVELFNGELWPMASKGDRHEAVRVELGDLFISKLPKALRLAPELGWRPGGDVYVEPDIMIFPRTCRIPYIPATEVQLLVEVARSSLEFDREVKSGLYAALGVREYWVVDAAALRIHVYRRPVSGQYTETKTIPRTKVAVPLHLSGIEVRLKDLFDNEP